MPDIYKADYGTIAQFGTREEFDAKLRLMGQTLGDVVDYVDECGVSLLGRCIISRKFDFAKELLAKKAKVNVVTKEGNNELHLIAGYIRYDGALDVAWKLLDRGVSLTVQDRKYKNTALFSLCLSTFASKDPEYQRFLKTCIKKVQPLDWDIKNKAGISLRSFIQEHGSDELKKFLEETEYEKEHEHGWINRLKKYFGK